jgi:hypothetical protein
MAPKRGILVLPVSSLYKEILTPEADAQLHMLVDVTFAADDRNISSSELAQKIGGYDAVLTGWRLPRFTDEVLDAADRLQSIAHSAGSIIRCVESYEKYAFSKDGRSVNDIDASTIQHFRGKLLHLRGNMNTETSRRMANAKHDVTVPFLEDLFEE